MPAFSLVCAPHVLSLMLLRPYNAPLPLIEKLKLLVNTLTFLTSCIFLYAIVWWFRSLQLTFYLFCVISLLITRFILIVFLIFPSKFYLFSFVWVDSNFKFSINPKLRYWILAPFIFGANPLDQWAITHSLNAWLLLSQRPGCLSRFTSFST